MSNRCTHGLSEGPCKHCWPEYFGAARTPPPKTPQTQGKCGGTMRRTVFDNANEPHEVECEGCEDCTARAPAAEQTQHRVHAWMLECFGAEIAADKTERSHRFIEEALELVQAAGITRDDVLMLVDYTFGRPVGELPQEVGGVMVTLAALCTAHGVNMDECANTEIVRVWGKIEQIRRKQAGKPRGSPLPAKPAAEREGSAIKLLREIDEYLSSNLQNSVWCGSRLHQDIKRALANGG